MKIIKYIFEALLIYFLFLLIKIIGLKKSRELISSLFFKIGFIFKSKKVVKKNITNAFGNISESKIDEIIKFMWRNYACIFVEYIFLHRYRLDKFKNPQVKIKGKKVLDEILKLKKQVIFVSGHFGNFELMAMELEKFGIKTAAIYRPLNNYFLNPLMEYLRMKYICPNQIPKGRMGMREIINKIKNGYSIALMVDQRVGEGLRIPLFNKKAHTTTIPAQIALRYNCKLVPISLKRKEGANFEMKVFEPYKIKKTGDLEKDTENITLEINKILEKMIINNPSQWLWSHNRWK